MLKSIFLLLLACANLYGNSPKVAVGSEQLFITENFKILRGKKIGLVTNHTAVTSRMVSTITLLKKNAKEGGYALTALFAPEHGLDGKAYASKEVSPSKDKEGIPIHSLHGATRRPTEQMLKNVDLLIYDIQDIGSRSYTYVNTLFFVMEEAAKHKIPILVLDRPNPINGKMIDGPMMLDQWRSILGYVNVPYCHGMTVGELAQFFNEEYKIGAQLTVIKMAGWERRMSFQDTGLPWIPSSPHIPEASTTLFYPTTGLLGELSLVNIGIGYTLPFKLVGAPWIDADQFAETLNKQKSPGVHFEPFHYRPFFGKFAQKDCQGVLIVITDREVFRPVSTQYMIMGILKNLYPKEFKEALQAAKAKVEIFHKANGTDEVFKLMNESTHIIWPLKALHQEQRNAFLSRRKKYLLY